jgi:hypothetical protein
MFVRAAVVLGSLLAITPVLAETMNADAARRFVAGKLFTFTCFEGSTGTGRIFNDGSVAGVVRMRGTGNTRFMHLPPGTLYPKGEAICSNVKGAFFNPCFDLVRTSGNSFRGAISGFGFAYCEFVRRGGGRGETVQASIAPASDAAPAVTRVSIRRGHKPSDAKPVAAPVQPVSSAPLPSVEQAGMRSSIAP